MPNRSLSAIRKKAARQAYRFYVNRREPFAGTYNVVDCNSNVVVGQWVDEDNLEDWFYGD